METDRDLPERKTVKAKLKEIGIIQPTQIDALLRDGWKRLVGETRSEIQELREQLDRLRQKIY